MCIRDRFIPVFTVFHCDSFLHFPLYKTMFLQELLYYISTSPTGSENHLSHYDFKHLTEKYFEIGMRLIDFSIQLVKYCTWGVIFILFDSKAFEISLRLSSYS